MGLRFVLVVGAVTALVDPTNVEGALCDNITIPHGGLPCQDTAETCAFTAVSSTTCAVACAQGGLACRGHADSCAALNGSAARAGCGVLGEVGGVCVCGTTVPTAVPSVSPSSPAPTTVPTASPSSPAACPGAAPDEAQCSTTVQRLGCDATVRRWCPATCDACSAATDDIVILPAVNAGGCAEVPLCQRCTCRDDTDEATSQIECVQSGTFSLLLHNISGLFVRPLLGVLLRQTPLAAGVLYPASIQPWAEAYQITSFELDTNFLTFVADGTFAVASHLETLVIQNQPGLTLALGSLDLPLTLATLEIRAVVVSSVGIKSREGSASRRLRRQSDTAPAGPSNLTALALSDVGLSGGVVVGAWFGNETCTIVSLELSNSNVTSVDTLACAALEQLDLTSNEVLNCTASLPFANGVEPVVRDSPFCVQPDANCTVREDDVAPAKATWVGQYPPSGNHTVFVTGGQSMTASPTWDLFQTAVLMDINIGAVMASAAVVTACPVVDVVYNFTLYNTTARTSGSATPRIVGLDFDEGAIDVTGEATYNDAFAVDDTNAFAVDVGIAQGGNVHSIGTFDLVIAPALSATAREDRVAFIATQVHIGPIIECEGGRNTEYRVRPGTSIPDGLELDTASGFLRGVVRANETSTSALSVQLQALEANESLGPQVWPIHLDCVDENTMERQLPTSNVVIYGQFFYQCPTQPIELLRTSDNFVPSQELFQDVDGVWFNIEQVPTFTLPSNFTFSNKNGSVAGFSCLARNFTIIVRVSRADAYTLCQVQISIHENSGAAMCPENAGYVDVSNNAHDNVYVCVCEGQDHSFVVNSTTCGVTQSCPANQSSNASRWTSTTWALIIAPTTTAIVLCLVAIAILETRRRRRKHRHLDKLWSCVSPAPHLEVHRDQVEFDGKVLGTGHFGVVTEVRLRRGSRGRGKRKPSVGRAVPETSTFACKRCLRDDLTNQDRDDFVTEIDMSVRMEHPNVLRTVAIMTQQGPADLCMITELCPLGDLHTHLRVQQPNNLGPGVSQVGMLQFCLDAAQGLAYLASQDLVHRDIACRNLFVTADSAVKIGDFGLSRRVGAKNYYHKVTDGVLPIRWMAPEALRRGYYTAQSDLWSLGVVFWEIFSYGDMPYVTMDHVTVVEQIAKGYRLKEPVLMAGVRSATTGASMYKICLNLWHASPQSRPQHRDVVASVVHMLEQSSRSGADNDHNHQFSVLNRYSRRGRAGGQSRGICLGERGEETGAPGPAVSFPATSSSARATAAASGAMYPAPLASGVVSATDDQARSGGRGSYKAASDAFETDASTRNMLNQAYKWNTSDTGLHVSDHHGVSGGLASATSAGGDDTMTTFYSSVKSAPEDGIDGAADASSPTSNESATFLQHEESCPPDSKSANFKTAKNSVGQAVVYALLKQSDGKQQVVGSRTTASTRPRRTLYAPTVGGDAVEVLLSHEVGSPSGTTAVLGTAPQDAVAVWVDGEDTAYARIQAPTSGALAAASSSYDHILPHMRTTEAAIEVPPLCGGGAVEGKSLTADVTLGQKETGAAVPPLHAYDVLLASPGLEAASDGYDLVRATPRAGEGHETVGRNRAVDAAGVTVPDGGIMGLVRVVCDDVEGNGNVKSTPRQGRGQSTSIV